MTREHIEFVLSEYSTDALADKLLELFDEEAASYQHTINKLNKALSENKGDLISRQAVLDELKKWDWQDLYLPSHFKQILDDVPSVENKGEWIEEDDSIACRCSECGCGIFRAQNWFKFCPNCGADMREPKGEKGEA